MVDDVKAEQFREPLFEWWDSNFREFPWRETTQPYEVLVAEILLSKTPATKVESLYESFLNHYPSLESLADADQETLANLLRPLGLQNRRAEALIKIGDRLAESGVPESEERLLKLPYVGKYASNATLCFAYGKRRPIVDTNVYRIYDRVFNLDIENPQSESMWEFAEQMLPDEQYQEYNLSLIDFGALVCTSQSPDCQRCFANSYCHYYQQEIQ